jgi:hypothetical protein
MDVGGSIKQGWNSLYTPTGYAMHGAIIASAAWGFGTNKQLQSIRYAIRQSRLRSSVAETAYAFSIYKAFSVSFADSDL